MNDGELLFARRLAFAVGRLDFWNVYAEMTPYELNLHWAAQMIDPIGDDRDDMRAAITTLPVVQSNVPKPLTDKQSQDLWQTMTRYTPFARQQSTAEVTAEESARQGKAAFAAIGRK